MKSPSRSAPTPTAAFAPASGTTSDAWWWRASLCFLALAIGIYLLAPTEADPDLWGHLRFGLDLLDTGQVMRPDTYSYLSGPAAWINHEWLTEALMALAYRAAGVTGLVMLKLAIGVALATLLVWHLRSRGLSLLASLLITAYGLAVILPGFRSLRPQAFTYLAFLITLLLVSHDGRGSRWMWLAAPLFALWVNLHGGFVAGLGVLLLWAAFTVSTRAWLLATIAGLATVLNPYGVTLWTFLWRTLGPRPDIAEWQSISLASVEGAAYLAVVLFGALGVRDLLRARAWFALVLFLGGALLPFVARRHLPLFVLMTIVLCSEHAAATLDRLRRSARRNDAAASPSTDRFRPLVAFALAIEAVVLLLIAAPHLTRIRVDPAQFPIAPTAWLAASGVSANLAVDFDWGEYVIWHAGPRVKVSVDGRRETVYSDAAYEQNRRFTGGADDWDRLLVEHPTDLALVSVRTPAFERLTRRADWPLLMHDDTCACALFGRATSPATATLRATPIPASPASASAAASSASGAPSASGSRSASASPDARGRETLFP